MPHAVKRDLHQSRTIEAKRGLAAPQIGRAEKALGHGDEIRLVFIDRLARCGAGT
jgi:uncharacterized protein YerC